MMHYIQCYGNVRFSLKKTPVSLGQTFPTQPTQCFFFLCIWSDRVQNQEQAHSVWLLLQEMFIRKFASWDLAKSFRCSFRRPSLTKQWTFLPGLERLICTQLCWLTCDTQYPPLIRKINRNTFTHLVHRNVVQPNWFTFSDMPLCTRQKKSSGKHAMLPRPRIVRTIGVARGCLNF